jgi:putative flippase GtrA
MSVRARAVRCRSGLYLALSSPVVSQTLRASADESRVASLLRLARAGIAGAAATLVDLGVLSLLVTGFGMGARIASVPALVAGGVANFVGNRHFAFRAGSGSLARQAVLYTLTEVIALALNGALYDLVLRTHPAASQAYVWVRIATSHLVFLGWSYPLWQRVFAVRETAPSV